MNETNSNPTGLEQTEHCISVCNSLLRGEISAVETYEQAIEKFRADPDVGELIRIKSDHEQAVQHLRNSVIGMHGLPEDGSGAWGAITKTVQATANLFGENSATLSLKQGEMLGKKAYETALEDDKVMPECKNLMRGRLLPMVNTHLDRLEQIGKAATQ